MPGKERPETRSGDPSKKMRALLAMADDQVGGEVRRRSRTEAWIAMRLWDERALGSIRGALDRGATDEERGLRRGREGGTLGRAERRRMEEIAIGGGSSVLRM